MAAYYNELDPFAAQWLRNLIEKKLIAPGDVDERSIADVRADDLVGYTQCHFFAGLGGWSYALRLGGWPDDEAVWTASCPCQPFSGAGKRRGFDDDRHLWPFLRGLISKRHPSVLFGEQVARATEWLRLVRGDLEAMGYAVGAVPIEAACAGADHFRDRNWLVADRDRERSQRRAAMSQRPDQRSLGKNGLADAERKRVQNNGSRAIVEAPLSMQGNNQERERLWPDPWQRGDAYEWLAAADGKVRRVKSGVRLLAHGIPARVGRLRAYGNAIVPQVAAEFIRAYRGLIE